MVSDSIADLFTRIRNAQSAGHKSVRVPVSKMNQRVLSVLRKEGFLQYFETRKDRDNKFDEFEVGLKYYAPGDPAISQIKRLSTPGRRQYSGIEKLGKVHSGLGIAILSTSQGVMSDREARERGIGGEVLGKVE